MSEESHPPSPDSPQPDTPEAHEPASPPALPAPEAVPKLAPVTAGERYQAVDTLRGFAVLGILVMNIYAFSMPFAAYANPLLYGGSGIHYATWVATHLFFDQKFMAIFAMLFGAGLALMAERAEARGKPKFAAVYYRRMGWLVAIGAVHGYLIWFGDILVNYACCGLLLYPLRRWKPKTLIVVGAVLILVPLPINRVIGAYMVEMKAEGEAFEARLDAGETLDEEEEEKYGEWQEMKPMMFPTRDDVLAQIEVYRGGYAGIFAARAPIVLTLQTFLLLAFGLWRMGGLMLLGMALSKLGVFRAARSPGFYKTLIVLGYGLGLPLVAWSAYDLTRHRFEPLHVMEVGILWNYLGSIPVAFGHVGLVMLVARSGVLAALRARLAAVGRMALTNYLMHSILLTTVMNGYAFGLYGHVERFYQMGFVAAVWLLQLAWSPWWLERFRFGPFEWLWRSLTYWRRQPMRVAGG